MNKKNMNQKFIGEISRIKDPEIFLGVARILRVPIVEKGEDEKYKSRDFTDICKDVILAYDASNRKRRRELYTILKQANSLRAPILPSPPAATTQEESSNANRTENSEAIVPNQEV